MGRRWQKSLPQYYYVDHYQEILQSVDRRYRTATDRSLSNYIGLIKSLPFEARCLYLRLVNRKPIYFELESLTYEEIPSVAEAVESLEKNNLLTVNYRCDCRFLLRDLTAKKLRGLLKTVSPTETPASRKEQLVEQCLALDLRKFEARSLGYVKVLQKEEFQLLTRLYYGRSQSTNQLAMRDMSDRAKPQLQLERSQYLCVRDARSEVQYDNLRSEFELLKTSKEVTDFLNTSHLWPETTNDRLEQIANSLKYLIALKLERLGEVDKAIKAYQATDGHHASERLVRLLYKTDKVATKALLEQLIDSPASDKEYIFATDFYERKYNKKRVGVYTEHLKSSEVIKVDECFVGMPEDGAKQYYKNIGYRAYKTENKLWRTLFGLVFWDLLFNEQLGSVTNPFQTLPTDLIDNSFYKKRAHQIEKLLSTLECSQKKLKLHVTNKASLHWGHPQSLVKWSKYRISYCLELIENVEPLAIGRVLRCMAQDYESYKSGFPDLMLVSPNGSVEFKEIKTSSDSLRAGQLRSQQLLEKCGLTSGIARIVWKEKSDQPFCIVDVETTGGRALSHRVTEIGVVKYVNGIVVDELQTLINPRRPIPHKIQKLTGITDEMVSSAPYFEDIADHLKAFLEGSIFAAHHVAFDYSFIREEFARIGTRLKMPRLCTCVSMRRAFPGLSSYSLKNLSHNFSISLVNHHRALDDAKAAGELLALAKGWTSEKDRSKLDATQ